MHYTEIGSFSFSYGSLGVHGMGISSSSNFAVLYEAAQSYLRHGPPLSPRSIAEAALRFERRWALGAAVAADDVFPITYGGLVKVYTEPNRLEDHTFIEGKVRTEQVSHDPGWVAEHVVVAFDPHGERHDVPNLLRGLCDHPRAKSYIPLLSGLADQAAQAIGGEEIDGLAAAINDYKAMIDEWMKGRYLSHIAEMAAALTRALPDKVAAWKPPGAGASKSVIVIVRGKAARDQVIGFFDKNGWTAVPAYVTTGVCGEFLTAGGSVRLTAGHRIDFVGGADLGQDVAIGVGGICCSCAIEPRSEFVISTTRPMGGPNRSQ
jgi:hypothetical protein